MKYLLKWMVTFLAFTLVGYLAGKAFVRTVEACPLDGPSYAETTPPAQVNDPPDTLTHITIWPPEVEGLESPFFDERIEAWLLVGPGVLHWFDRWPLALSLPQGEYTLIIKREAGSVQVIPLRVGPLPIEEFAFLSLFPPFNGGIHIPPM